MRFEFYYYFATANGLIVCNLKNEGAVLRVLLMGTLGKGENL